MKLKSIKISNILNFKYYENVMESPEINFNSNPGDDFHILIGPNGSGKSNFLEILNQIFKNILSKHCQFNKANFLNLKKGIKSETNNNQILQILEQNDSYLNKNWNHANSSQHILLSIVLNDNDYNNINFIIDNAKKIDLYLETYSRLGIKFADLVNGVNHESFKANILKQEIDIHFSRNDIREKFNVHRDGLNNEKKFIIQYFECFEFLKGVIDMYNIENPNSGWSPLKDTFVLIGCYRNYNTINSNYPANNSDENSVQINIYNKQRRNSTSESIDGEPYVFDLVKHKLSYEGVKLFGSENKNKEEIIQALQNIELYKNINKLLKKFLAMDLQIKLENIHNWTFGFHIKSGDQIINFRNLSAGQKGIIHIIFSLYGHDVENGLFIIDEPELHLHPQFQKGYIEIMQQEGKKRNIQFIVSTHSPVFVSEKTISNVKRFYFDKKESTSKVMQPKILEEDKFLIKVLSYTNASKIFFVDRAILVEGESDEYFFNFYINYLKEYNSEIGEKIDDFEVYNIGGKNNYRKWKSFLQKWGLKVVFICDWDNITDFGLITMEDLNICKENLKKKVIEKIGESITDKNSKDGRVLLKVLFDFIENYDETKFQELKNLTLYLFDRFTPHKEIIECLKNNNNLDAVNVNIESKYADGVYILKEGELEDYLDINEKGLNQIIDFCNNFDISKLKNKEELEKIISHIFS